MNSHSPILQQTVSLAVLAFVGITGGISIASYRQRGRDPRLTGSVVLGPDIRGWYFENLQPFEKWCVRWGVSPAVLSYGQLLGSALVGLCYAGGALFTAGWLLLLTGTLDVIDGRVARRTGGASRRGAFLDSIIDRYVESFAYFGLALFFRHSWVLCAVLFALLGSIMVSYARARGESLGAEASGGVFQRPERIVFLGFGTIAGSTIEGLTAPWFPGPGNALIVFTVLLIAVVANITALQRVISTWRVLNEQGGQPHAETVTDPEPPAAAPAVDPGSGATTQPAAGKAKRVAGTFLLMMAAGCVLDWGATRSGSVLLLAGAIIFLAGLLDLRTPAAIHRAASQPSSTGPDNQEQVSDFLGSKR